MKALNNILVVVDKPKHEQIALQRALTLQRQTGARLHLRAFTWDPSYDQRDAYDAAHRRSIKQHELDKRRHWLSSTLVEAGGDPRHVSQRVVWSKDIASWITSSLASKPMDLVLKHAHRSQSLTHTPTDWNLIRDCPAPILLCIRKRFPRRPKILVALDLHNHNRAHQRLNRNALACADIIRQAYPDAELHCVYALPVSPVLTDLDMINPRVAREKARARIQGFLDELLGPYGIPRSRVYLPIGKVGHAVNSVASKLKADLLVMGTTSRKGLRGFLLGNSAERVLAKARCDVLAVKP
jgi:universal stress protein E